jgi:hypothetical protein
MQLSTPRSAAALPLTPHARRRAHERSIPDAEIDVVRRFGKAVHANGRFRITLDGVSRPLRVPAPLWLSAGSVVVVEARSGWVVTVYRRAPFQTR